MSASLDVLKHRIQLLALNQPVVDVLQRISPFIDECLDGIIEDFYAHMQRFPEGRKLFADPDRVRGLKAHQVSHWQRLFKVELDAGYLDEALRIGTAHYRHRVAPHLYIAGYTFFQAALLKRIASRYQADPQLPVMSEAVTKLVGLDMDLALSVYVRALWQDQIQPGRSQTGAADGG